MEAYEACVASILHPLTEQMHFILENETDDQKLNFVAALTKHLPQFMKLSGEENDHQKLSPAIFRELKKLIKETVSRTTPIGNTVDDEWVYQNAMCQFYQEVFKSRGHIFDQIGVGLDDLIHVFAKIVQDILDSAKDGSATLNRDVSFYVDKLSNLFKQAVSKTCNTEKAEQLNRRFSKICTGKLNVPETDLSGRVIPVDQNTNLKRNNSKTKKKIEKPDDALLEFVRLAFRISEPIHQSTVERLRTEASLKQV